MQDFPLEQHKRRRCFIKDLDHDVNAANAAAAPQRKRRARNKNGQQCTARRLVRAGALVLFKSPLKGGRTSMTALPFMHCMSVPTRK